MIKILIGLAFLLSNGKIIDTQRSRRADKIRICFELAPNKIAEKGNKLLYIQVINPKNNLLMMEKKLIIRSPNTKNRFLIIIYERCINIINTIFTNSITFFNTNFKSFL